MRCFSISLRGQTNFYLLILVPLEVVTFQSLVHHLPSATKLMAVGLEKIILPSLDEKRVSQYG